ncbi:LysM peptidoglycan-binding domain-containing protein [Cellulomonas humilata]|uniref:LysM repeat protein n=1 Tax=Cellulomonas humilata TaxID=144055 RepID=A0ABU0EDE9_9CELL|nr:LysM domain-containing protein [Cellulomonas humilata]MDQ0373288.1 LysM repeat protein [Cellulomonas humilata]
MVGTGVRRAGRSIGGLLAGTLASATLAGVLALHVRAVLTDHVGPWQVDSVIEIGVAVVGMLVALWLAAASLLGTVCVVVRTAGASWRAGERLVHRCAPQVVRKALVLAVGAGIGLGMATGASATALEPSPSATVAAAPTDLGWSETASTTANEAASPSTVAARSVVEPAAQPVPAEATPAPAPPEPLSAAGAPASTVATVDGVVVAAGDSLWSIAARHLPPGATDAQVAAAWPRWYAVNAAAIGADPDLIRPGQVLAVPVTADGAAL